MRSSIKVLAVMAIALWICIGVPVTSLAGTEPKPHDPQQAPTFQDQAKYLSAAQIHSYEAKLSRAESIRTNRQGSMQSSATATYCCIPNSIILSMTVWYEGSGDCMCGPATVTEMLSTTTDYITTIPTTTFRFQRLRAT